jgi:hypothetical protein
MSKPKFTKGKWLRTISPNGCNHVKCDGRRNNGYIIASTCGSDEVANAHLIAAAPEMYKFLDDLANGRGIDYPIEQLLAKARGEHE